MNRSKLQKIVQIGWLQRWSGSYTFISCSYWGPQYHSVLKKILGIGFDHTLFIHRKGTVSFYVADAEFRKLGRLLANKSKKDYGYAKKFTKMLKVNTDILMPLMSRLEHKIPNWTEYQKFLPIFERHLAYHVFVKKTIDFLPVKTLNKLLPLFKDSRIYSEKIYSKSESFFRNVMKAIARKEKYNAHYLTCLTQGEFENYLRESRLPSKIELKKRYLASALYFEIEKNHLFLGNEVSKLEKLLVKEGSSAKKELSGIVGYPGKTRGVARVVPDPFKVKKFNRGDILVTGMTRPEFLPLIERASAIVTESGGILSHAAITAREFKKPCVVGTQIATKVLKDGYLVEVDADKGIVKILKKAYN